MAKFMGTFVVILLSVLLLIPMINGQTGIHVEDVVFYGSGGATLVGKLFVPDDWQSKKAIVFYHGFGGDKEGFYSDNFPLAQELASKGYLTLIYDNRAHGQSSGDFDVEDLIEDGRRAITLLQNRGAKKIGVGGHSLGGMLSVLVSACDSRVDCTVAWAAPKNINSAIVWILRNLRGVHVSEDDVTEEDFLNAIELACSVDLPEDGTRFPINIGSLHTSIPDLLRFFADCQQAEFKPIKQAEKTKNIRFVHGTNDPTVNPQDSRDMHVLARMPKDMVFIVGAGHGTEFGHREEILNGIVEWFRLNF